ncbi:serine/threonine protein phosphatase type 5,putative [Trypanosoma brucei gambiense DAL972]|uniref:Serine/threonine-protein phosphatase T n=1 Tax=Trypanosoma brucei gambiense (strain MHOM/CI/86/DAL972) TaxID=679716 RepID=D0A019_TRYB9|nr:serine/threonine protein phosphatase type 5,putative [Trypanosoma brucei gambiense DAL972]CBH16577.1 serine/threonine protein phosphatase type 5,putative [Trypanosoma brucei gambiense DAL972]|eukprot:XP_011778841.1 serine/threonine protein phosphatase type 5,putative [Trypanosoma brucei gambiense DAL972]
MAGVEEADKLKQLGNAAFSERKWHLAIDMYTKAIELTKTPTLFCNRALAELRAELPGAALADADAALGIEPTFAKAYYHKASAYLSLGKHKQALTNYKKVVDLAPQNTDAQAKVEFCKKEIRRINFENAITTPDEAPLSQTIKLGSVRADYDGPRIENETVTVEFVEAMKEHFRLEKLIDRHDVIFILLEVQKILKKCPNFVSINVPVGEDITVCGDTHGQYYDLLNIFKLNGNPLETNRYLFNGDFVDRGSYSFENIMTLFAYKVLYPDHFFLSRGNHEGISMNRMYGFEGEVTQKYNSEMFRLFTEVFNSLPIGHIINNEVFVVHGGLYSSDKVTLDDLQHPNRFRDIPESGLICESLWSDPQPMPGRAPSKRGVSCLSFGPDVTETFLNNNNLKLLVRSHEVKDEGYEIEHGGKCITVFSAPNYCDQMGNKGAFIRFTGGDMKPRFTTFAHVPHPGKRPMHYATGFGLF